MTQIRFTRQRERWLIGGPYEFLIQAEKFEIQVPVHKRNGKIAMVYVQEVNEPDDDGWSTAGFCREYRTIRTEKLYSAQCDCGEKEIRSDQYICSDCGKYFVL